MHYLQELLHHILHIDHYLNAFISAYGFWTYLVLFAIIFCETGLVVMPLLPGDSLLFAAGSLAAQPGHPLDISLLFIVLVIASILGNQVNFLIGKALGPHIFSSPKSWLLNKKYLEDTRLFYEKHGGKTLIFARFLPIIRTFAPFVAGIGAMKLSRFFLYNLLSALLWIGSLLGFGYFLGSIPIVKNHFSLVIYGIILLTLLPPVLAFMNKKTA